MAQAQWEQCGLQDFAGKETEREAGNQQGGYYMRKGQKQEAAALHSGSSGLGEQQGLHVPPIVEDGGQGK